MLRVLVDPTGRLEAELLWVLGVQCLPASTLMLENFGTPSVAGVAYGAGCVATGGSADSVVDGRAASSPRYSCGDTPEEPRDVEAIDRINELAFGGRVEANLVGALRAALRSAIECPADAFMAIELQPGALATGAGLVRYRPEFTAL